MTPFEANRASDLAHSLRVMFIALDADDLQALTASDLNRVLSLGGDLARELCNTLDGTAPA